MVASYQVRKLVNDIYAYVYIQGVCEKELHNFPEILCVGGDACVLVCVCVRAFLLMCVCVAFIWSCRNNLT